MNAPVRLTSLLAAGILAVAGCERSPDAWTPVLGDFSTSYLDDELGRAQNGLVEARGSVRSDPERTTELLEIAEGEIRRLREVYLPLFEAREMANNAYRLHFLRRDGDAADELEGIRATVLEVSRAARGPLLGELERIQELVGDARLELEAGSPTATAALHDLVVEMEDFVTKAGIFIGGGA